MDPVGHMHVGPMGQIWDHMGDMWDCTGLMWDHMGAIWDHRGHNKPYGKPMGHAWDTYVTHVGHKWEHMGHMRYERL